MYSNDRQYLLPREDTANPEGASASSRARPASSLQQPVASAENILNTVASPGNGSIHPSTSDIDLRGLGSQLTEAIMQQDLSAVNNLLDLAQHLGIDPDICNRQGNYPLYSASYMGRADGVLKTLLDRGANPNLCNIDEWDGKSNIPLLCAAHTGSYEVCKVLLEYGADPQARDRSNWTALHWATLESKAQSVMLLKYLLDHGVDINARTHLGGKTPLSCAVINNILPAVNTLLDEGSDPDIPDTVGITPLGYAVFNGRTNMVDDLLAHGANPDTPYGTFSRGWSNALCIALGQDYRDDIVAMLLAYGANPNKVSKKGYTPLHLAIKKSNSICVDMLLAHGANPNIRNPSGKTALEAAKAAKSPPGIIAALSEPFKPLSLQVCARNCIRATLMRPQMTPKKTRGKPLAIKSQHLSVPSLQQPVASAGNRSKSTVASPDTGSIYPSTFDHDLGDLGDQLATVIKQRDNLSALNDLLNLLEERGVDPNLCDQQGHYPLFWFIDSDRVEKFLKTLLDRGIDPNIATIDPLTHEEYIPLLMAAKAGSYEISKALLDHGAVPQAQDRSGFTALHWATRRGSRSRQTVMLLKCLLDHGVDINACNGMGRTPLCDAATGDKFSVSLSAVNTLLDEDADPNIPDNNGHTALHYAIFNGHTVMVDDLLAHGANPNIRNPSGQTALEAAQAAGAPPRIMAALGKPCEPVSQQICARNCSRATLMRRQMRRQMRPQMRPKMTLKKTRAKPLSIQSQHLPLPDSFKKFVSNSLTL